LTESRRNFLKNSALAGAALTGGAALVPACTPASENATSTGAGAVPGQESGSLPIQMAGYPYDRVEALIDGRVQVEGADVSFEFSSIGEMNVHVFDGPQTREVTEIGLHPFMLAYANQGFRGYSLIPVFPLRVFRHKSVFIRTDRGIETPEDLRGKKIATSGYSSTSLTWIRGVFREEYGLDARDMEWIIASSTSDSVSGTASAQESVLPDGVPISAGPAGVDESQLLLAGEVDALFHAVEPKAYTDGDPIVGRLFPDYRATERAYFARTGIFPIMHAVAIRDDVIEQHPWLPLAVFNAYSEAKQLTYDYLRNLGWAMVSLPWIGQELAETRELMGENYWPYGVEPNRKTLETLFRYSHEQGLASRVLTVEELFHPSILDLVESQP
jgi:4,5-dihydroxyphthalate decarboxylase